MKPILVGHSYGGMVITGAADRAVERVGRLVYLDPANPVDGQSLVDVAGPIIEATRPVGTDASRRFEAASEHPRVATVAIVLLRNEFVLRGVPTAPDDVLIEVVDEVYLPLVWQRSTG